ncbi:MAG: hypothetical protein ACTSXU_13005, partial [Promethearchaeota archaeon]
MSVGIFQFNGCDKCFNETLLMDGVENIKRIKDPKKWAPEALDVAVITGYLVPEDEDVLKKISSNAKKIIAYGSCPSAGGIFGLAYQKGILIKPLNQLIPGAINVNGCLANVSDLVNQVNGTKDETTGKISKLCDSCQRKATCEFLDEVHRLNEFENDDDAEEKACLNDKGYICNGFISSECKEHCIDFDSPCRGCTPNVDRSGVRLLGMVGTLLGNIEVATEATGKGGTDKLADEEDEIIRSVPDVVGTFFRFTLPSLKFPPGKKLSSGNLISDIFVGRLIEELPAISAMMGGEEFISFTLDIIEAYENGLGITISEATKALRT